jgi:hypothetical protein
MTTTKDRILCDNADGHQPRPAVVRVSWPGGRFQPAAACAPCLQVLLHGIEDGEADADYPVLVSPLKPPALTGYSVRDRLIRALSPLDGCDAEATADVVLKALGMEETDGT